LQRLKSTSSPISRFMAGRNDKDTFDSTVWVLLLKQQSSVLFPLLFPTSRSIGQHTLLV